MIIIIIYTCRQTSHNILPVLLPDEINFGVNKQSTCNIYFVRLRTATLGQRGLVNSKH